MPKNLIFLPEAWDDFNYWLDQDKKMIKRIRMLIQDIDRNGFTGIGKPEPLKGNLSGWWSRRIDEKNRLIYRVGDEQIEIAQCRSHYDDR